MTLYTFNNLDNQISATVSESDFFIQALIKL